MLRWISMLGGLLIMMGRQARSEALFYYFRLEDQIPEDHLQRGRIGHAGKQRSAFGDGKEVPTSALLATGSVQRARGAA